MADVITIISFIEETFSLNDFQKGPQTKYKQKEKMNKLKY
jgi:hypothetical protein